MEVTETELIDNLEHYLDVVQTEVVMIVRDGRPIARLAPHTDSRSERMESLFGSLPEDVTLEEARSTRFRAHGIEFD